MRRIRGRTALLAGILLGVGLLAGCGASTRDADAVIPGPAVSAPEARAIAENMLEAFNGGDYSRWMLDILKDAAEHLSKRPTC